jgi:hypothetical protein
LVCFIAILRPWIYQRRSWFRDAWSYRCGPRHYFQIEPGQPRPGIKMMGLPAPETSTPNEVGVNAGRAWRVDAGLLEDVLGGLLSLAEAVPVLGQRPALIAEHHVKLELVDQGSELVPPTQRVLRALEIDRRNLRWSGVRRNLIDTTDDLPRRAGHQPRGSWV